MMGSRKNSGVKMLSIVEEITPEIEKYAGE